MMDTYRRKREAAAQRTVDGWNAKHPIGTAVHYWGAAKVGAGTVSRTRSEAWQVSAYPMVLVEGFAGGIALTHVEVVNGEPGT